MQKGNLIKMIVVSVAWALFAGFSAFFTATSLSLNLLHTNSAAGFWIVFVLVFIIAYMAGYCLTLFIEQLQKRRGASKWITVLSLIGFLLLWALSFTTNVHYFFVEKHGYSILNRELTSAKDYINDKTKKSNAEIENSKNTDVKLVTAQISTAKDAFEAEINSTLRDNVGFGDKCITILNDAENTLLVTNQQYNDPNTYVIYDDVNDAGDRGTTQKQKIQMLYTKYSARMLQQMNKKIDIINRYYDLQKDQNEDLLLILENIRDLGENHLPIVQKDGTATAYWDYQHIQQGRVVDQMPEEYHKKCVEYDDNGNAVKINVYPSARMFETMTVWGDMFGKRLPDGMPMLQWIIISLIFDIMAFLLFYLK